MFQLHIIMNWVFYSLVWQKFAPVNVSNRKQLRYFVFAQLSNFRENCLNKTPEKIGKKVEAIPLQKTRDFIFLFLNCKNKSQERPFWKRIPKMYNKLSNCFAVLICLQFLGYLTATKGKLCLNITNNSRTVGIHSMEEATWRIRYVWVIFCLWHARHAVWSH